MSGFVYIAVSLDGFIATRGDGLEWLEYVPNSEKTDYGYAAFMEDIDAIVMGRRTFEVVSGFGEWPYRKPVFVLSRTITEPPKAFKGRVRFLSGEPFDIAKGLGRMGYKRLYIDGGQAVQSFLAADLIDSMTITRFPVLLGGGIPLFGALPELKLFHLAKSKVVNKELVMSTYVRHRQERKELPKAPDENP